MLQKLFINPNSTSLYSVLSFLHPSQDFFPNLLFETPFHNITSDYHVAKCSGPYMTSYLAFDGSVTSPSLKHSVLALASPIMASWFSSPLQGCYLLKISFAGSSSLV